MNISATYMGKIVNIVDIDVNGSSVCVVYKDTSNNLIVDRGITILPGYTSATIALSATGT